VDDGKSIISVGEITKPATVLIEKISDGIGGLFKPFQTKRNAKAEAEAEIIKANTQVEVTEVHRRAMTRFIAEEAKKQENMEKITEKAISHLEDSANPKEMEDDWIANFFDKCRIISDNEMQSLWAKVLAGEANSPGFYSKRTVNLLNSLDKKDANLFTSLCSYVFFVHDEVVPLIFDFQYQIYSEKGIDFGILTHLDNIGLINFKNIGGFVLNIPTKRINIFYYGKPLNLEFQKDGNNQLELGTAMFTQVGEELFRICGSKPLDGFIDYIIKKWSAMGIPISSPYPQKNKSL
jgi:hypothetical protein